MASLMNSTRYLRKEIMAILHKRLQKTEKKEILACSFYEARIILITKLKIQGKKLYQYPSLTQMQIFLKF